MTTDHGTNPLKASSFSTHIKDELYSKSQNKPNTHILIQTQSNITSRITCYAQQRIEITTKYLIYDYNFQINLKKKREKGRVKMMNFVPILKQQIGNTSLSRRVFTTKNRLGFTHAWIGLAEIQTISTDLSEFSPVNFLITWN